MEELDVYKEQFEQVIDIIESAKERAYRKVNEELILIERLYSDNELKSGLPLFFCLPKLGSNE